MAIRNTDERPSAFKWCSTLTGDFIYAIILLYLLYPFIEHWKVYFLPKKIKIKNRKGLVSRTHW